MLVRKSSDIRSSEITSEKVFRTRRMWLQAAAVGGVLSAVPSIAMSQASGLTNPPRPASFAQVKKSDFSVTDKLNSLEEITHYNNFTEFGGDKSQPARNAQKLSVRPWTVTLDGLVKKPKTLDIDNILANFPVEERIYRLRCVEAWSMVIPWLGIPLVEILKQVEPLGSAKYVQFTSLYDSKIMAGAGVSYLEWPYKEGLRLDEARHPLSLLVVGLYGELLPRQNGAPLRIAVPWKYGFKGAKSIVKITFTEKQPTTTWNLAQPNEYGFYANVNPDVDHPRWSQAKERRIGQLMRYPTSMFNGYANQVASLYSGIDLKKNY